MAMVLDEPVMAASTDPFALYEAKALAELADADALAGVRAGGWSGDPTGTVALVSGGVLPDEAAEALDKALAALGFDGGTTFAIASRPKGARPQAVPARLRLALEAVDVPLVLAVDPQGAIDLASAFGVERLDPGRPVRSVGRVLGSVGDFAASLPDPKLKARSWAAIRAVAAAAGHTTQTKRP
ncbi:MAG TPA: hypothetical protein VIL15_06375 [Coriobacteriia bacterium]